jgi:integrase
VSVKIREKRRKLYLDIYQDGKRTWEALHLTLTADREQNKEIMRLADVCRSKREMQVLARDWDIQDPIANKKKLLTYLEECAGEREHNDYITGCIRYLKNFKNGAGASIQLSQITPRWIEEFQRYLLNQPNLSAASAHDYSRAVRMVLRKAVRENILIKNPAESVKGLPVPETDLIFLNIDEIQKLANTPIKGELGAEVRTAFLFACYTGLRISDLKSLKWGDIERNPLQIIKRQKKTRSTACIPLSKSAWSIIEDARSNNPGDNVFSLLGNTRSPTNRYLIKWAEEAGVTKRVGWHTARRTFATLGLENGADIYTVSRLLGHVNIKQVARYAKVTDKLRREAVAALPEITL